MTQERKTDGSTSPQKSVSEKLANSHYSLLGLNPWASEIEIRRTYRHLSKLYHPDTTNLPPEIAKAKFQQINEAYGTLSNPERRLLYDYKIGYYRVNVLQAQNQSEKTNSSSQQQSSSQQPSRGQAASSATTDGVTQIKARTAKRCWRNFIFDGMFRSASLSYGNVWQRS